MGRPPRGVILALLPFIVTAHAARLLRQDEGPAQPVSLIDHGPNGQGVPYQPNNGWSSGGWSGMEVEEATGEVVAAMVAAMAGGEGLAERLGQTEATARGGAAAAVTM